MFKFEQVCPPNSVSRYKPVNSIDNPIAAIKLIRVKALKSTPHNEHIPYVSMIIIVTVAITIKPETISKPRRTNVNTKADFGFTISKEGSLMRKSVRRVNKKYGASTKRVLP